jgi:signal transduction histidine kinase
VSVRDRLIITFAIVGVLLVLPTVFATSGLRQLTSLAIEARDSHAEAALAVGRVEAGLAGLDAVVRIYVAAPSGNRQEEVFSRLDGLLTETRRIEDAGYLDAAPPLRAALADVRGEVARIDSLVNARRLEEAGDRLTVDFASASAVVRDRLAELAAGIDVRAQADFDRARSIGASALQTTLVALIATIAIALLLSAWTTTALIQPLHRLRRALSRVTEGHFDLPRDLPYGRTDEIGELAESFGIMSKRLAELDRLRAEFLGVASHELKTPINVIRGYTELIEEELAGELTTHQREIMQRIEEQTRVLTRQVSRLMDISRLETGSYMVEPESILLADLILGVERTFEVVALEKGVHFSTEIDPDAPERLVVDVDLIRDEVLANLVSNALKFTPSGGRVSVHAWGEERGVVIEVADTGPGIPPEHRSHIFDKYYQVERSRSMGSGLGLAIAKELVEVHGGSIGLVDSEQGATFRVMLPVTGEKIREEARLAATARSGVA